MSLTALAVSALALLEERPMHPYEMLQTLRYRGRTDLVPVKVGSLYHTMARLADLGLAQVRATERDGNRPERTVYALTPAGREAYVAWVRTQLDRPATPDGYALALAEAHNLDLAEVTRLLTARLADLTRSAEDWRTRLDQAAEHGVAGAYVLEQRRRLALIDADIAWTAQTLEGLTAGTIVWPHPHSLKENLA